MGSIKYVIVWINNNFPTDVVDISDIQVIMEGQTQPYERMNHFPQPNYANWNSNVRIVAMYRNAHNDYFVVYNNDMVSNNEKLGVLYKAGFQ
jgi:hypothetical protein